jgi:lipid II:glycine glycyltransferase (peptidoglycan interpeptide bridge formation enzyme)
MRQSPQTSQPDLIETTPGRCHMSLPQSELPQSQMDRWKAWDSFVEATPQAGFMQASWYADFRASVGYQCFAVTLKDDEAIVGGALVMKWSYAPESCFYYISDGPVLPQDESTAEEVFETTLQIIDQHRRSEQQTVSHLRIEPRWQQLPSFVRSFRPLIFPDAYTEPRTTLWIDLQPTEDAILAQMKPKGRYNVRLAQRHGVSVIEDTSEQGLADFMRIYRTMADRKEIEAKPARYFRRLYSLLAPRRQLSIFCAQYQGQRLAAALVVYFGRRATYFFGASLAEHRNVMAPYLLHFEIMRSAKARGCDGYDLWGFTPSHDPNHPWWKFSVFKSKFGGVVHEFVPTLDYVYDAAAYDRYVAGERATDAA